MVYVIQVMLTACSQAVSITCMTYTIALYTVKNFWWWTEELPETCRGLFQKLIWEISASSWFYYKNLYMFQLNFPLFNFRCFVHTGGQMDRYSHMNSCSVGGAKKLMVCCSCEDLWNRPTFSNGTEFGTENYYQTQITLWSYKPVTLFPRK